MHKIFKFSFKIRYVYTPRVTTRVYMYWVPVIHRLYILQLNIFITCYYFSTKAVVYSDSGIQFRGKRGANRKKGVQTLSACDKQYCIVVSSSIRTILFPSISSNWNLLCLLTVSLDVESELNEETVVDYS